jgi:hypothetical protein
MKLLYNKNSILLTIYKVYFPHEINSNENIHVMNKKSLNSVFKFMKEFDICPAILSKTIIMQIYQSLTDNNTISNMRQYFNLFTEIGKYFTFIKFNIMLLKTSDHAYEKSMFNNDSSIYEKISLLLERMEISNGFCNIERLTHRTHSAKSTLINKNENTNIST